MNLSMKSSAARGYNSPSQVARILTETWLSKQVFCPNCGKASLKKYPNNEPVADFYCDKCDEDYELKSKKTNIGKKIVDGAYRTMIERLSENSCPNLIVMKYSSQPWKVSDLLIIPKYYFVENIIEKRKPLSASARRAGWVGCNIVLGKIPNSGRIFLVRNGVPMQKKKVVSEWNRTNFLKEKFSPTEKSWLLDVMLCVEKIGQSEFTLEDVYQFCDELSVQHPENKHVKDKIRQQLQLLRDKGYLEFISRGNYRLK